MVEVCQVQFKLSFVFYLGRVGCIFLSRIFGMKSLLSCKFLRRLQFLLRSLLWKCIYFALNFAVYFSSADCIFRTTTEMMFCKSMQLITYGKISHVFFSVWKFVYNIPLYCKHMFINNLWRTYLLLFHNAFS